MTELIQLKLAKYALTLIIGLLCGYKIGQAQWLIEKTERNWDKQDEVLKKSP